MQPRLVVLSGYPCSGKTTLTHFMQDELGFLSVGLDPLVEMVYNRKFIHLRNHYPREMRTSMFWEPLLNNIKMYFLRHSYDTVIDSATPFNEQRKDFFNTGDIDVEKYLIVLDVNPDVLRERSIAVSGKEYDLENWAIGGRWGDRWEIPNPASELGCKEVFVYPNNTREETEAMYTDLRIRFPRRWEPPISS